MFNQHEFQVGDLAKLSITKEAEDLPRFKSGDYVVLRRKGSGPYVDWYCTVLKNRVDIPWGVSPGNLEPVNPLFQLANQAEG